MNKRNLLAAIAGVPITAVTHSTSLGSRQSPYVIGEEVACRLLKNAGLLARKFRCIETIEVNGTYFDVYPVTR